MLAQGLENDTDESSLRRITLIASQVHTDQKQTLGAPKDWGTGGAEYSSSCRHSKNNS